MARRAAAALLLLCVAVPAAGLPAPSATYIATLRTQIRALLPQVGLGAKFVRLAFHDCVGGCDGCVDMTEPDNAGLDIPINALEPLVAANLALFSRADMWALAGLEAANEAQKGGTTNAFALAKWGRTDCGASKTAGPARTLPSANAEDGEVFNYFATVFGLSVPETTALLGAHSLGRASRTNSGFDGQWDPSPGRLDNAYYQSLLTGWAQEFVDNSAIGTPSRYQWRTGGNAALFMLNADIALRNHFTNYMTGTSGQVTCTLNPVFNRNLCPNNKQTLDLTQTYSLNNQRFINDFEVAFKKMIEAVPVGKPALVNV